VILIWDYNKLLFSQNILDYLLQYYAIEAALVDGGNILG
jgi:hypothetical protein